MMINVFRGIFTAKIFFVVRLISIFVFSYFFIQNAIDSLNNPLQMTSFFIETQYIFQFECKHQWTLSKKKWNVLDFFCCCLSKASPIVSFTGRHSSTSPFWFLFCVLRFFHSQFKAKKKPEKKKYSSFR